MSESCSQPWQALLSRYSLKKRVKFAVLVEAVGRRDDRACLELGCGVGAASGLLESLGGRWLHADPDPGLLAQAEGVCPGRTRPMTDASLAAVADASLDLVVAVDLLEHLADERPLLAEVVRVLRPGGRAVVTTPRLRPRSAPAGLRRLFGLRPAVFGHYRDGYSPAGLKKVLTAAGLSVEREGSFLGPVTSSLETTLDGIYYRVFGRKGTGQTGRCEPGSPKRPGQSQVETEERNAPACADRPGRSRISPQSEGELRGRRAAFALYRAAFPLLRLIGAIDRLLPRGRGYGLLVVARLNV